MFSQTISKSSNKTTLIPLYFLFLAISNGLLHNKFSEAVFLQNFHKAYHAEIIRFDLESPSSLNFSILPLYLVNSQEVLNVNPDYFKSIFCLQIFVYYFNNY